MSTLHIQRAEYLAAAIRGAAESASKDKFWPKLNTVRLRVTDSSIEPSEMRLVADATDRFTLSHSEVAYLEDSIVDSAHTAVICLADVKLVLAALKNLGSSSAQLVIDGDKVGVAGVVVENLSEHHDYPNLDQILKAALVPNESGPPEIRVDPAYFARYTPAKIGRPEDKKAPLRLAFSPNPHKAIGVRFEDYFVGAIMPQKLLAS